MRESIGVDLAGLGRHSLRSRSECIGAVPERVLALAHTEASRAPWVGGASHWR